MGLHPVLARYREWDQLLKEPERVPLELWIRCVAPPPADWKAARLKYGPHSERLIQVYRNSPAEESIDGTKGRLPLGTMIAKEKLAEFPRRTAEGVAFMIKRPVSDFPDSDGWEFLFFPSAGDKRATQKACANCHHVARSRDYVFGDYPK